MLNTTTEAEKCEGATYSRVVVISLKCGCLITNYFYPSWSLYPKYDLPNSVLALRGECIPKMRMRGDEDEKVEVKGESREHTSTHYSSGEPTFHCTKSRMRSYLLMTPKRSDGVTDT